MLAAALAAAPSLTASTILVPSASSTNAATGTAPSNNTLTGSHTSSGAKLKISDLLNYPHRSHQGTQANVKQEVLIGSRNIMDGKGGKGGGSGEMINGVLNGVIASTAMGHLNYHQHHPHNHNHHHSPIDSKNEEHAKELRRPSDSSIKKLDFENGMHSHDGEDIAESKQHSLAATAAAMESTSTKAVTHEPGAAADTTAMTTTTSALDDPLPLELRRILFEVAQTGTCSTLPWRLSSVYELQTTAGTTDKNRTSASDSSSTTTNSSIPIAHNNSKSSSSSTGSSSEINHGINSQRQLPLSVPEIEDSLAEGATTAAPPQSKKHRNGVHRSNATSQAQRRLSSDQARNCDAAQMYASRIQMSSGMINSGNKGRKRPYPIAGGASSNSIAAALSDRRTGAAHLGAVSLTEWTENEMMQSAATASDSDDLQLNINPQQGSSHSGVSNRKGNSTINNSSAAMSTDDDVGGGGAGTDGEVAVGQAAKPHFCLKDVFRSALMLVLDHWFKHRGGYKLSPAEIRRHATLSGHADMVFTETTSAHDLGEYPNAKQQQLAKPASQSSGSLSDGERKLPPITEEDVFRRRRQRLLQALQRESTATPPIADSTEKTTISAYAMEEDGPPFTIQRIAEVLIAPERYYTQTHKLCNCLEKLLLVTSTPSAFGGSRGGITSQSRREELEVAALEDEKGRLQYEFRHRRLRRGNSLIPDEFLGGAVDSAKSGDSSIGHQAAGKETALVLEGMGTEVHGRDIPLQRDSSIAESREILEAAARASLRTKFDHVGIDPHSPSALNNRDVRAIVESRSLTNSPPPPICSTTGVALTGHGGLLRHHSPTSSPEQQDHTHGYARTPSPILFGAGDGSPSSPTISPTPLHANQSMHLYQSYHAAAFGLSPFELMNLHNHNNPNASSSAQSESGVASPGGTASGTGKDVDLESRSPGSSDVDSESDDISLDDSASDRSDGSDSGQQQQQQQQQLLSPQQQHNYEPFSVGRAMAWNRMQQQRLQSQQQQQQQLAVQQQQQQQHLSRLSPNRMLTSFVAQQQQGTSGHSNGGSRGNTNIGNNPTSFAGGEGNNLSRTSSGCAAAASTGMDAEYPLAMGNAGGEGEDSGGSDSSSISDLAD